MKKPLFLFYFFTLSNAIVIGQPSNNYSPRNGIIIQGNLFSFNSYLKSGGYKQFIDNHKMRADLGYFQRVHDGSFIQLYIIASAGLNTIEFNKWNPDIHANTFTEMQFIRPALTCRVEGNMGRKMKLFANVGYAHNFNVKYRVFNEDNIKLIDERLKSFGQMRGATGLRILITHKWSFDVGLGGDLPIGKLLNVENKDQKVIANYIMSGVLFRFK